jgi:DNA segregation ATPase FtsK/SpoIIIE, S-DNA-T family
MVITAAPVDHLADIATALRGQARVRTQVVLARLVEDNPAEYETWGFADLTAALAEHGVEPRKSHGVMVVRAEDLAVALAARQGSDSGDPAGSRGVLPAPSPPEPPRADLREPHSGRQPATPQPGAANPTEQPPTLPADGSLPATDEPADRDTHDG